jgi:hypothetical protein
MGTHSKDWTFIFFCVLLVSYFLHSLQVIKSLQHSSHSSADSSELHDPKRVMEVSVGKFIFTCDQWVTDFVITRYLEKSGNVDRMRDND